MSTATDAATATTMSEIHSGKRATPTASRWTHARMNGATTMMPAVLTSVSSSQSVADWLGTP